MTTEFETGRTAGQILSDARMARQLSIEQVALQLNLKPEQVEKLEQDQIEGMAETFARGYVRAYGRLLKVPEASLMAAFGKHTGCQQSSAKPMRTFSNRTARQATENRFMWLTYAIIVALLIMLFIWWWQSRDAVPTATISTADTTISTVQNTPAVTETPAETDTANSELVAAEVTPEQLPEMLEQLAPAEEVVTSAEQDVAEPVLDQLEMRFTENCWVDVVDAEGNRIAFGTKQAGYIMQVSGKAPFVVTLGNPSVVQINVNQQAFDLSSFAAGRVAKFTIPESD